VEHGWLRKRIAPNSQSTNHRALRNTIGDAIERSAACHRDKTAIAFADRQWSYAGLEAASNRVAHQLLAQNNCYGQSEIAPLATVLLPHEHTECPTSAGRPLQTVRTRIVDPVTGQECQPGE